jgi:hypothetical protein
MIPSRTAPSSHDESAVCLGFDFVPVNESEAIVEVTGFRAALDTYRAAMDAQPYGTGLPPNIANLSSSVVSNLDLVMEIAVAVDLHDPERIRTWNQGHDLCRDAIEELLGKLRGAARRSVVMGQTGPQLAAAEMHPWVWDEAAPRLTAGFYRDAVQAAATRIFDTELPRKLQTHPVTQPANLFAAFATDRPGGPALRFVDLDPGGIDWASFHRGVMLFGQACVASIRNPRTHQLEVGEEQSALEELAALSLLARWIDDAELQPPTTQIE